VTVWLALTREPGDLVFDGNAEKGLHLDEIGVVSETTCSTTSTTTSSNTLPLSSAKDILKVADAAGGLEEIPTKV